MNNSNYTYFSDVQKDTYDNKPINRRKVFCKTLNREFESLTKAALYCGTVGYLQNIKRACDNSEFSAGKHPVTKEKLYWEYCD